MHGGMATRVKKLVDSAVRFLRAGGSEAEFVLGNASVRLIRRGRWARISVSVLVLGAVLHRESHGRKIESSGVISWLRDSAVPAGDTVSITRDGTTRVSTIGSAVREWSEDDLDLVQEHLVGLIP